VTDSEEITASAVVFDSLNEPRLRGIWCCTIPHPRELFVSIVLNEPCIGVLPTHEIRFSFANGLTLIFKSLFCRNANIYVYFFICVLFPFSSELVMCVVTFLNCGLGNAKLSAFVVGNENHPYRPKSVIG